MAKAAVRLTPEGSGKPGSTGRRNREVPAVHLGWRIHVIQPVFVRLSIPFGEQNFLVDKMSRNRSVAILDESSLLVTAAYIDLNPLAAGLAATPEQSDHTSFRARIDHCRTQDAIGTLRDALSTQTHDPAQEAGIWLLPVDDRRPAEGARAGLMPGFTLSCYCRLIDWSSRLLRDGKAHVPAEVAPIFVRLRTDPLEWTATVSQLFAHRRCTGSHFGSASQLTEAARSRGRRWHRNQLPRLTSSSSAA